MPRAVFRVKAPGTDRYDLLGQIPDTSWLPGDTTGPKDIIQIGRHWIESLVPRHKSVPLLGLLESYRFAERVAQFTPWF